MSTATQENIQSLLSPEHVDMSLLPAPEIIETLDYETIYQEMLANFQERQPEYTALLESDPIIVALQCCAYREVLLRQRINEAGKANMLAYATGTDLENLAAFFGITRMDEEEDTRLRYRTNLALEGLSTAGSEMSYLFHTLSSSVDIKSASVQNPDAGEVLITILSFDDDGTASTDLLDTVSDYLTTDEIRPFTDNVTVQSADIVEFTVAATIYVYSGPSVSVTTDEYTTNLATYLTKQHNLGAVVALSGIYDALHTEGVQKISLTSPTADIITTKSQAAYCTKTTLNVVIVNDSD